MSVEHEDRGELVQIGALWAHEDQEHKTFFSGTLGEARLLIFSNKAKNKGDKRPDYRVYVANETKADESQRPAD